MDCHGHGSHVAGTVASKDYGVAPGATIVGVRVLSCSGSGSNSDVINGIFWAIEDAAGRPAVINMSLGGSKSSLLNAAVQDAVDAGITVVVAAGNSNFPTMELLLILMLRVRPSSLLSWVGQQKL